MNCGRFQKQLFEYVEGSLSPQATARAAAHLTDCTRCRAALRRHQELAGRLTSGLRQATDSLRLDPGTSQRVLRALRDQTPARENGLVTVVRWMVRWWPHTAAAGLFILGLLALGRIGDPASRAGRRLQVREGAAAISVQSVYPIRAYMFRKQGSLVLDTLFFETNTASGMLLAGNHSQPVMRRSRP